MQDKAHGVLLMNQSKYLEKFQSILQSNWLTKLDHEPTIPMENKRTENIMKNKFKISEKVTRIFFPQDQRQESSMKTQR